MIIISYSLYKWLTLFSNISMTCPAYFSIWLYS